MSLLTNEINDPWNGIFKTSQIRLHVTQEELQRSSHTQYYHRKPLIATIVTILIHIVKLELPTILHKIREHTNIIGTDLVDAAVE